MRQGQQHRRGRSRGSSGGGNGSHNNNHHRKGQNPLARSFESNGPDVKVRGTAADIAAKYIALARDAQSSGDPVLGESYLQHAEHYNRMIIAYREQQMQQGGDAANGHRQRPAQGMDLNEMGEDGEGDSNDPGMGDQPPVPAFARHPGQEPQPRQENGRHDERRDDRRDERRDDRRDDRRQHGRQQEPRHERGENSRGDNPRFRDRRFERPDYRSERAERSEGGEEPRPVREATPAPAADQPQPVVEANDPAPREQAPRRRERFDMMKDQPEFLRLPVRRPRRDDTTDGNDTDGGGAQEKSGA